MTGPAESGVPSSPGQAASGQARRFTASSNTAAVAQTVLGCSATAFCAKVSAASGRLCCRACSYSPDSAASAVLRLEISAR